MKILVFTEGTIIMHPACKGLINRVRSIHDYRNYTPIGGAVKKLNIWKNQRVEIYYLTSRTTPQEVADIKYVLEKYNFPGYQNLLFRKKGEQYKDVAERLLPDILVEDDCESIGGEVEMTYPYVRRNLKKKIKPVVVKEFGGIDHLPDDIKELFTRISIYTHLTRVCPDLIGTKSI